MKIHYRVNFKKVVPACLLAATMCFSACAVGGTQSEGQGKSTLLAMAAESVTPAYGYAATQNYKDITASCESFASKFAAEAYSNFKGDNMAVSPISIYMALSLVSECANGDTKQELSSVLGLSDETMKSAFATLYGSLNRESRDGNGKLISTLKTGNSVWVGDGISPNQSCLDALSDSYYCSSYSADFENDNLAANRAVKNFVKEQTNGLIDKNFELDTSTVFALINTLYLKDVWDLYNDLSETSTRYTFTDIDNAESKVKLLLGKYISGRAYETEKYSTFYTMTTNGYKLKFIVPSDGYTIGDVFNAETIETVNSLRDYNAVDDEQKINYRTRCLFPQFEASYDGDVKGILKDSFGICDLFDEDNCNLTNFCDVPDKYDNMYCKKVHHVTKLTVDKEGIEGAAVTVVAIDGTTSIDQNQYTTVYKDFVVNKSFGYILTNADDVTLFSGVVNKV